MKLIDIIRMTYEFVLLEFFFFCTEERAFHALLKIYKILKVSFLSRPSPIFPIDSPPARISTPTTFEELKMLNLS